MKMKWVVIVLLFACIGCNQKINKKHALTEYSIFAELDTTDLSLDCKMSIKWFNSSEQPIEKLPFHFQYDSARTLIKAVFINNQPVEFEYYEKDTAGFNGFVVYADKPVDSREACVVKLDFNTRPNEFFRENMLFYTEDFPVIQYFEDGVFNPNYQVHANYNVNIKYPVKYSIASSGLLVEKDTVNDIVNVLTEAESIPFYGFLLTQNVEIKEDTASGVLIRSFYFKDDAKWGTKFLDYAKNIINFYSDTLEFYPQPVLNIMPGYPHPYGGWPICPNIVGIHRGIDEKKERAETHGHWIMAHEIGHQYWGFNYVLEPLNYPQWFGISMGLATDEMYAQKYIPEFDHTQYFRKYYLWAVSKGFNTTIMQSVDSLDKQDFDWNNAVEHNKSYLVLHMLSNKIGAEQVFYVMKSCLEKYKGMNVTLDMFQSECERISNLDLNEFFETWYRSNKYLEYQITNVESIQSRNERWFNELELVRLGEAQVPEISMDVVCANGDTIRQYLNVTDSISKLTFETTSPVEKVVLDPDFIFPLVNRENWRNHKK